MSAFHAGMHEVRTVVPEQRQVSGFSRHSEEGQRQVADQSFVRLVDVIPESGIQQGRPMGPLGVIAGRAMD